MKRFLLVLSLFCTLGLHAQPPTGLIASSRATNWSNAGVTGGNPQTGTLPSATWTQCGSTIAAYSGTTDTINEAIAACGANQYVQLAAGNFNLTSGGSVSNGIVFSNRSNVALRGMGANQTFLVMSSSAYDSCSGGYHAGICSNGSRGAYWVTDAAASWSAGYSQGTTQITLSVTGAYSSSTSYSPGQVVSYSGGLYVCEYGCTGSTPTVGYVPWSNISANNTIIGLDQCSLGNSGSSCSSNAEVDNGNYFDCDIAYNSTTGNGCAVDGPDGGNQRLNRPQNELFQVSAVNASTGQLTLMGSLRAPNWSAAETPQGFIAANPNQYVGIENLSLDVSAGASDDIQGIVFYYAANSWVSGVEIIKPYYAGIFCVVCSHNTFQFNYIYSNSTMNGTDIFSSNSGPSSDNLFYSNISQWNQVCIGNEGADTASVYAYNFCINDWNGNSGLYPSIFPHAGDRWQLWEGNISNGYYGENYHGPKLMTTAYRNFFSGWESCANTSATLCGGGVKGGGGNATTPFRMVAYSRYHNVIANVLGTPGYTSMYSTMEAFQDKYVYGIGEDNGSIPSDPVVANTLYRWGNWDPVSNGVRWCGSSSDSGWASICSSTSEVPTGFSPYGQPLPTYGDTGTALPASLWLSTKPSWWNGAWPGIGPDVSGGNIGQCSGTFNAAGKYAGVAATSNSQCTGTSLATAWGGHVYANPAMNCFLNVMGGPPDGTNSSALSFNASTCYAASSLTLLPPTSLSAAAH